jgi:DNA-directed RNA polymerase specialized sigma24 family protein
MPHHKGGKAPMDSNHSVTDWINRLQVGDAAAAQPLFERYFAPMVQLARARVKDKQIRVADEEDVALSAFDSFCRSAKEGKFPRLDGRGNLWGLLVVIATRKAVDYVQRANREKRGGGAVRGDSAFGEPGIEQVIGTEPSPDIAAMMAEAFERRLDLLPSDTLRAVALLKLDGYTNEEIATKLTVDVRTIERKLNLIRSFWQEYRDEQRHDEE